MRSDLYLEWNNIAYSVPKKSIELWNRWKFWNYCEKNEEIEIIKNCSGYLKAGDFVAILGSSGAGKTTLLAAISQRLRGNISGEITLNGLKIDRSDMTNISSFLPQYNISVKTLNTFEHLYFMSHFKMDKSTNKAEKIERVNSLLEKVGLKNSSRTKIMHLSGGERKRLSLAEELITDPPFLFCDEPTTGLDSYNAYSVIKILRQLTQPNKKLPKTSTSSYLDPDSIEMEVLQERAIDDDDNWSSSSFGVQQIRRQFPKGVMCSIHQPTSEVFELFTHLILMDNGKIIYQGSTDDAVLFFSKLGYFCPKNCSPADFYLKLISNGLLTNSTRFADIIRNNYEQEIDKRMIQWDYLDPDSITEVHSVRKISWFYQMILLIFRNAIEARRNIKKEIISTSIFMITSVTLAIMYSSVKGFNQVSVQDITGSFFMISTELVFTASYSQCYVFAELLPILRRETGEGNYKLSAYYFAMIFSLIPKIFIWVYIFFGIIYAAISYSRGFWLYVKMSFTLALATICGTAYGIFISSIFESDVLASEMAAPFDLLFLVFGGIYYNVNSIPLMKYISLFYFVNEGLLYDYWREIENIDCVQNATAPCLRTGVQVLDRYSFNSDDLTVLYDYIGLIILTIIFHLIAYFNTRRFVKRLGYY